MEVSSPSAVAAVMVEEGIHDGILTQIFDFVAIPSGRTDEEDDPNEEIFVPGTTQDEIINLTLVSKRFYRMISTAEENGSKKWHIVPVLEIGPPQHQQQQGDLQRLINNIRDHGLDANGTVIEKFQDHRHMVVYDSYNIFSNEIHSNNLITLAENIQLPRILSLAFAPPSTSSTGCFIVKNDIDLLKSCIVTMLPNLLDIDMSNIIDERSRNWNFLDRMNHAIGKIRWNNINYYTYLDLNGLSMIHLYNLRQLVMDNSIFICFKDIDHENEERGILDFEEEEDPDNMNVVNDDDDHKNIFIFHFCCQNLDRLSIRNAKYIETPWNIENDHDNEQSRIVNCLTQKALIKFVRHAPPTLKWFRSDLSPDNIRMLQPERPTIEFLN